MRYILYICNHISTLNFLDIYFDGLGGITKDSVLLNGNTMGRVDLEDGLVLVKVQ